MRIEKWFQNPDGWLAHLPKVAIFPAEFLLQRGGLLHVCIPQQLSESRPGRWPAKQMGHSRLQWEVISSRPMQVCCSCSVQIPQS